MFDEVDISTSQTSDATNVENLDKASIHIIWSGTSPVGEIKVQARNGEKNSWFDVDFGDTIDITGNSGDHVIIMNSMPFTHLRLTYTSTSGTGTLTGTIVAKQVGG